MSVYELAILGSPTPAERHALSETIEKIVSDFGLALHSDVVLHNGDTVSTRDRRAAFAATYFAGTSTDDIAAAKEIKLSNSPIIPTFAAAEDLDAIPEFLRATNGHLRRVGDVHLTELATALLECVGLLRRQRRIFVSYRRTESRAAAVQLHDALSARGFDVFLDTHDIRPGDPFQEVLWNRLCDSDVLVMLDTATYFESKWTRQELGRALAKQIHVLRVIWPDRASNELLSISGAVQLTPESLLSAEGPITEPTVEEIVLAVEDARSRSIAMRYKLLATQFRDGVAAIGAVFEGIGAHRAMTVRLQSGRRIHAYPIVGVPTAELLHEVANKFAAAASDDMPILVYDHVGIGGWWSSHLRWLDENLDAVRAVKVAEAAWTIAGWDA